MVAMDVMALGWLGTRTPHARALADFYANVLGLRATHTEPGFWVFTLPDGNNVEVFDPAYPGKAHFDTGPVAGFTVRDLPAAVAGLRAAGVELVGEPGPTWQHFRGPDGNVYELVAAPAAPGGTAPA
jgi:catechol 2,3-dioxygenase-like lactoylglutathione lyase family enzyme